MPDLIVDTSGILAMPLELERAGLCHIGMRKSRVSEQMQAPVNRPAGRSWSRWDDRTLTLNRTENYVF